MAVSVESLSGLERRVTVLVQREQVEQKMQEELTKLVSRVQIDGFRRGHVPLHIVKQRYANSVRLDVGQDLLKDSLDEALRSQKLVPINTPTVDLFELEEGKDFRYAVIFEVYPEFELQELTKKTKLDVLRGSVTDQDVAHTIERIREQNKSWKAVTRAAKMGDQVKLDFKGYQNDQPFEGGEGTGLTLVLGSHQMIPGFEEGIVKHHVGKPFSIDVVFPADYHEKKLAGQATRFDIVLHEIAEGELPEVNDKFLETFGITSGGIEALQQDIRQHMEREMSKRLREINHDHCFSALAEKNQFEIPTSLVEKEIGNLKHELYHQLFGQKHTAHEKIPDFPRDLFEERAKKRVKLGLVVSEYVKKHKLMVEEARVEAMLDQFSTAYDDPESFKTQTRSDDQMMAEIEAIVLEQMIAERILETVTVQEKQFSYESLMNYKAENNIKEKDNRDENG